VDAVAEPVGHAVHAVLPAEAPYDPAAHGVHELEPVEAA
jgi:hypothetical protein